VGTRKPERCDYLFRDIRRSNALDCFTRAAAGSSKARMAGISWQEIDNDLLTFGVGRVVINPQIHRIIHYCQRSVCESVNGGQHWFEINEGWDRIFAG